MAPKTVSDETLSDLLELIYPIQYKWGFTLEDILRSDALSRMQVVILWLIRCEGEDGRSIRRRDIQRFLAAWFEASNSTITKALRSMARPPLKLIKIIEHPHSGREKKVVLTAKGQEFFLAMLERCREFLEPIATQIGEKDIREGIRYLKKWISSAEALSITVFPKNALLASGKKRTARTRQSRRIHSLIDVPPLSGAMVE
jgi:DNA-binding MarR family transcriptional regulator